MPAAGRGATRRVRTAPAPASSRSSSRFAMKTLAAVCIRRPVFAAMLILALTVIGTASYLGLGVDRFPAVDLPTVFVRTSLPGASPEETEVLVSQRIEEAINTVE